MRTLLLLILSIGLMPLSACGSGEPGFYEAHQYEYLNIPNLSNLSDSTYEPYIIGKVITINIAEQKFDDIYNKLPKDLKATNHEEVGIVVWLEWGEKLIGTYTDGWKGYAYTCNITIIDFANTTIINEKYFKGADPPDSKNLGGDVWGSMPTQDIIKYIEGLPRTLTDKQAQTQTTTITPASTITTEPAAEQPAEPIETPTQSLPTPELPVSPN